MAANSLDSLPEELISVIATWSDASTAIRLAQTCRRAQVACFNIVVFQEIIRKSQKNIWTSESLNMEAIRARAGKDVSVWARYAVADYELSNLQKDRDQAGQARIFLPNEPELFLVNHPALYQQSWQRFEGDFDTISDEDVYCIALSILASKSRAPRSLLRAFRSRVDSHDLWSVWSDAGFLWALCISSLAVQTQMHYDLAARLDMDRSTVPHTHLPSPTSLLKLIPHHNLPVPFSKNEGAITSTNNWPLFECQGEIDIDQDIIGTRWCGYYTYLFNEGLLDPPMSNIVFEQSSLEPSHLSARAKIGIKATGGRDGRGPFNIDGSIVEYENGLMFQGRKNYVTWGFEWRLKWLSRNMAVGFWGVTRNGVFYTEGLLCLWKVGSEN